MRQAIGRTLSGDSANQRWEVMEVLAVTDFPDIRLKSLIQSANEGTISSSPGKADKNLAMIGGFILLAINRAGRYSVDTYNTKVQRTYRQSFLGALVSNGGGHLLA